MAKLKGKNKKWGRCDTHGQGCSVSQDIQATPVNRKTEKDYYLKGEWKQYEVDQLLGYDITWLKWYVEKELDLYLKHPTETPSGYKRHRVGDEVLYSIRRGEEVSHLPCEASDYVIKDGQEIIVLYEEDLGVWFSPKNKVYYYEECYLMQ